MSRKRFLPPYVTEFTDRHGRQRYRFRRKGYESRYIAAQPGTEAFRTAYRACMDAALDPVREAIERTAPGTIDDLVTRYLSVPSRLGPTATTQMKVKAILSRFRTEHGKRTVAGVEFEHIERIVAKRVPKVQVGKRMEGGVEAARKLRKELVRLFDFAVKLKMRQTNPAREAGKIKVASGERSKGFHTWTEVEIAQYRERHPLGSKARLAMELLLWTGQRRTDAIWLGPKDVRDGRVSVQQSKSGKALRLPLAPQLVEAIVAMPPFGPGQDTFVVNDWGQRFAKASFGNKMRDWCDQAGLPHCTAHGLRKAMMRRLAELHMGNQSLKAVSGHSRDEEVATYTREVDQARMADQAIALLSRWESEVGEGVPIALPAPVDV